MSDNSQKFLLSKHTLDALLKLIEDKPYRQVHKILSEIQIVEMPAPKEKEDK